LGQANLRGRGIVKDSVQGMSFIRRALDIDPAFKPAQRALAKAT
jgi:hypothetical protein